MSSALVILSRSAKAARTARSGSSSCAAGTPKTAMIASPMNFSTVPPWARRISLADSNAWPSDARTTSGSWLRPISVDPTMSANRTVTSFRSSGTRGA